MHGAMRTRMTADGARTAATSNIGAENFSRRSMRRRTIAMTNLIDRDGLDGGEVERDVVRVLGVSMFDGGVDSN